ncbi:protein SIEVE ELEMENT OCCLUSION B-like [Abrus precatorius]|uniref:Protein SIEVE ELEMENT OCCLUSION B-like n=1 Tax=Abrus precatorius TaxID=3816 RepID=A0A8B8MD70_ABRPR|nr:protein SIEVE ELEMENT OCCLUSION B-like [Abrus precatorius]
MSQSNAADENATPQQKVLLPNPFDLKDSQILERVYLTHLHDEDKCDVDILWNIVSNVLKTRFAEGKASITGFQPDYRTMKLISCQMITTPCGERYVHQTTMWILQHLKTYSWDAKALVALAAFALEYGNLLHLTEVPPSDQLANSLKQLNQVQTRKMPVNNLVELVMEALQNIQEWATWSAVGYNTLEVPSLSDALHEVPVVVYWILASIIAATGNLVGVSEYSLSDFTDRLSLAVSRLQEHLKYSKEQIDYVEEYSRRKKAFSNPKDIVEFLKLLIQHKGSKVQVYDGSTKNNIDIEVLRQKHVLLFISSLDKIEDEILLLNSLHERLQENPKEIIKDYKKEDFKILWIPIVTVWDDNQVHKFHTLKDTIKWYAVEYFYELPGTGLIKEKFNYWGNPIIPVLTPLGDVMNEDAMDLIFQWGIDAFPFRKIDGIDLTLKWKWFWDVTKKVNLGVQVKGDRYIFIYGGSDKKWIQDFTLAVEKTKRHATISRADAIIDHYQLGRNDPKVVPRFWIEIESKKLKKHKDALDCEIQEIVKSLLCLKQDPQGWAILTKGSNVKLLGHGEPMYQTLAEFEIWKDKVLQKEGFDIAFKEYYEAKLKEIYDRQPCAYMNVDNNTANVVATITCPNPTCGRVMEVTSVSYKCCHRDAPNTGNI